MSAEVVNLRLARKAKARAGHDEQATLNRLKFGRSRTEREGATRENVRLARHLDLHLRDAHGDEGEQS